MNRCYPLITKWDIKEKNQKWFQIHVVRNKQQSSWRCNTCYAEGKKNNWIKWKKKIEWKKLE